MSELRKTRDNLAKKDHLKERIKQYVREGLPVRTDTVMRLAALDPDSEMSLEDLSAIILEDIGLTAKVIQTVNSFYYRRVGHEVTSVTQAVVLLGFNTIREIALGMALIDLAEKRGDDILISLIFSSYFGAHLAQELLENRYPPHQSDAIMVAGLFHAIARIILALDSEEAYNELEELERTNRADAQKVLKELGTLIATHWKLPPFITENLEGLASDEKKIPSVISGAHILGRGLAFPETTQDTITQAIRLLSSKVGLAENDLKEKVGIALNKAVGLSSHFRRFVEGESNARFLLNIEEVQHDHLQQVNREENSRNVDHQFMTLFTQLSSAITARRLTLDQAFLLATETIYRGMGVDWVILMLLTKDRKMLLPRYGLGPDVKIYKRQIKIPFPPKERVLKTAFNEDREVIVSITTLCKGEPLTAQTETSANGVCAVSPIIVESKPIGCFIMNKYHDPIGEVDLLRLKAVKDLVVMATMRR